MSERLHALLSIINPWGKKWGQWPHLVALAALLIAVSAGAFTAGVEVHRIYTPKVSGGFHKAPLPPPTVLRGGPVPASWSLVKYLVRVHDQDNSGSCVGQTGATIEEITWAERGKRIAFSTGYLYNQINHGFDGGATYPDMFGVLVSQGDAPLMSFGLDGFGDVLTQPRRQAITAAAPYRFRSWFSISSSDRFTMMAEIHAGRPLGVAFAVLNSFYSHWSTDTSLQYLSSQSGFQWFSHSMTAVGYNGFGLVLENSWGPRWGFHGRIVVSWQFLIDNRAEIVGAIPQPYNPPPPPPLFTKFQAHVWGQFRAEHHKSFLPYKSRGHLTEAALLWKHHKPVITGGIVRPEQYHPFKRSKKHPHGFSYEQDSFQGYTLTWWPGHPTWQRWRAHSWLR